ncbi:exodeoxyribonuclease VII large subunit [Halothiobacillus diazotrophicus]|uniref:Exodeoxyribonuclease 7 large subunit n=1 Tax=Halothiobacillus diazotrophicus TaxID=1860122 RepID=A0A191ZJ59_9GAMM|nr:exodeoxyribonuclease VII large subunit [Halothiobacillus diazotrophicus]ANJ67924.1 exodeoxyribonuclease VII large subunit [Halothiobacillus diazotrophicus]
MSTSILSVYSLNQLAKQTLEAQLSGVQVAGEIRSLTRAASGHMYFTLKDDQAEVRCALFRGQAQRIRTVFANGDAVVVLGSVSLYAPRGDYQLIVQGVELAGDGRLAALFEALKKKLLTEGLFDAARKRPLPITPHRIAVISSPVGAAIHDVLSVLARRWPLAEVTLYPVAVQGEAAAGELTAAVSSIRDAMAWDVVLIVRGGGSMSDLWAFNDEALARAIAACPVPVISGVGHEVDFTICDFVADVRAATPTAAAELATPQTLAEWAQRSHLLHQRLNQILSRRLNEAGQHLDRLTGRLRAAAQRFASEHHRRVALELRLQHALRQDGQRRHQALRDLAARLARHSPVRWLRENRGRTDRTVWRLQRVSATMTVARAQRLHLLQYRLHQAGRRPWQRAHDRWQQTGDLLAALSPQRILERGYVLVEHESALLMRAARLDALMAESDRTTLLTLRFADGAKRILARPDGSEEAGES